MNDILIQLNQTIVAVKGHMPFLLSMLGLLWGVHLLNLLVGYRLNVLGIHPRQATGLLGIVFSPFLHGDFNHLFFNSIPLFILAIFVLFAGNNVFFCVTISIILISGLMTWLMGRKAIHIGASSLIIGYWSYLLTNAITQNSLMTIALALVCIYYFGSFFLDLLPGKKEVSWEGHLFGFIAGLITSYSQPFICPYILRIL